MNDQYIMIPAADFIGQLSEIISEKVSQAIEDKAQKSNEEKLLSAKEVCELFQPNISRVTLHTWTKEGKLQPRYIGTRVYYLKSEIMEAVKVIKKYGR